MRITLAVAVSLKAGKKSTSFGFSYLPNSANTVGASS